MEKFKNIFEVRKALRFELLEINKSSNYKFNEDILKDINFLNNLLKYENKLINLGKTNQKRLQDLLDENILKNWIENSFQIIKNQICTLVYNSKTVFEVKPSEKRKKYELYLKLETEKDLEYFIPKEYINKNGENNYIPEEDFYKAKDSEIWYSIKLISTLIKDNELISFTGDKDFREKLKNIKNYNPNWENFFELFTLNPYTTKRWKKDELENNYKIAFEEYKKQVLEANKIGKEILEKILENNIFDKFKEKKETDKTLKYFGTIFSNSLYKANQNNVGLNHLILLVNKYESFKNGKNNFKDNGINDKIKDLHKKLREINKISSELFGYKIHLLDNFGIEKFSFLIKSKNYYFVGQKSFKNEENGVSKFQEFVKKIENKNGNDKLYYLDSMTWGGFKKLFISKYSDIKFEDGTFIKTLNKYILEIEDKIIESKKGIIDKIKKSKTKLANNIKQYEDNNEKYNDFLKFLNLEDKSKLFYNKKGKYIFDNKKYGRELNNFCSEKYNFDNIKNEFNLDNLEKQYFDKIIELLKEIKNKNYKVGGEDKNLSFLGENSELEKLQNLEELENYFNDNGYKIIDKNIDLEKILELSKKTEENLKIFQVKSKDLPYHPDFVNEENCGNIKTAINDKKLENNKKDLNTIYFESFFEDIEKQNKYARLGADFKVRGIFASSKNNYDKFLEKEKNKKRHIKNKENIENFVNRFKRDRKYIDFTINLNATSHNTEEKINNIVKAKIKEKLEKNGSIKVLSLDHGESSFLTYKIFEFEFLNGKIEKINEIKGGNYDNFKENTKGKDSINKEQVNIQIDKKEKYEDQKILENYITKYHLIIQDQKRERQVQEALKNFARNSISKIKEIISNDKIDKNKKGITKKTAQSIKDFLKQIIDLEKSKNKENIFYFLNKFKFNYNKYIFYKTFPDQKNLKEKIDKYINGIRELLEDDNKLRNFCNKIKESFGGKTGTDFEKLKETPFYSYKDLFSINLKQINNLKKGYSSVLVGKISKMLISGDIDIITLENNILSYGTDGSKVFQKDMGTSNHPTFIQALINKLSFSLDKETKENFQFVFPVKATNTNKLKNKENGVLFFIDENKTSKICPKCGKTLIREKSNGEDWLYHKNGSCNFEIKKAENKKEEFNGIEFNDGDDLACFNIAKEKIKEYIENLPN